MPKEVAVKVADLVLDFELYPRRDVSSTHVTDICDAILAGNVMPAIVICRKSKRVLDGFHRVRAHNRLGIKVIRAVLVDFQTEREMFQFAISASASHGLRYDKYDKAHILSIAGRLGIPERDVAKALGMEVTRLQKIMDERMAVAPGGDRVVLKKALVDAGLVGTKLTKAQAEFNRGALGNSGLTYIHQLIGLIKIGCLDLQNEEVKAAFAELVALLREKKAA